MRKKYMIFHMQNGNEATKYYFDELDIPFFIKFINALADRDLQDKYIAWNCLGLCEWDEGAKDYLDWYNEHGQTLDDIEEDGDLND